MTYEQTIEGIESQGEHSRQLARQILSWILYAKKSLSSLELRYALAVRPETTKLDEDYIPSVKILQSKCPGLVTVDEESDIVRLVHYTTQEYFERTQMHWFPEAEIDIATACVTYLSFEVFESGYCPTDETFEERLELNPLYLYSAENWGHHLL